MKDRKLRKLLVNFNIIGEEFGEKGEFINKVNKLENDLKIVVDELKKVKSLLFTVMRKVK